MASQFTLLAFAAPVPKATGAATIAPEMAIMPRVLRRFFKGFLSPCACQDTARYGRDVEEDVDRAFSVGHSSGLTRSVNQRIDVVRRSPRSGAGT
ncbi:hypothetical protein GCM10027289_08870 [Tsukamurella serpentis]